MWKKGRDLEEGKGFGGYCFLLSRVILLRCSLLVVLTVPGAQYGEYLLRKQEDLSSSHRHWVWCPELVMPELRRQRLENPWAPLGKLVKSKRNW